MRILELIEELQDHYSLLGNVKVGAYKDDDKFFTIEGSGWTVNEEKVPQVFLCV